MYYVNDHEIAVEDGIYRVDGILIEIRDKKIVYEYPHYEPPECDFDDIDPDDIIHGVYS